MEIRRRLILRSSFPFLFSCFENIELLHELKINKNFFSVINSRTSYNNVNDITFECFSYFNEQKKGVLI